MVCYRGAEKGGCCHAGLPFSWIIAMRFHGAARNLVQIGGIDGVRYALLPTSKVSNRMAENSRGNAGVTLTCLYCIVYIYCTSDVYTKEDLVDNQNIYMENL